MEKYYGQRSPTDAYSFNDPTRSPSKGSPQGSPNQYGDDMFDDLNGSLSDSTMKLPVKSHINRLEVIIYYIMASNKVFIHHNSYIKSFYIHYSWQEGNKKDLYR